MGVSKNQPEKLAAFEGRYATRSHAPLSLFGWVNEEDENMHFSVEIPWMLSWMVHGDPKGVVTGLEEFPREDRPPVNIVFQTYHAMVAIGMGLIGLSVLGIFLWWRGTLWHSRWMLRLMVIAVLGPQFANQLGWMSAEIGRQPWVVYRLMRTSEGLSQSLQGAHVLTSLVLFSFVYILLFVVFVFLLDQKIKHGPTMEDDAGTGHHRA